ncbi:MAG: lytic transglycosylase domain-containing protein [Nitrospinota bacterium]
MKAEDRYDSLFRYYAEEQGVPWLLLKAQVKAESGFNPDAVSKAGATGLAQFMSRTFEEWRDGTAGIDSGAQHAEPLRNPMLVDPRDPEDAIGAQAAYMRWLLDRFDGDTEAALAAYNWGIGRVKRVMAESGSGWVNHLPKETHVYVGRVLQYLADYGNPERGLSR